MGEIDRPKGQPVARPHREVVWRRVGGVLAIAIILASGSDLMLDALEWLLALVVLAILFMAGGLVIVYWIAPSSRTTLRDVLTSWTLSRPRRRNATEDPGGSAQGPDHPD